MAAGYSGSYVINWADFRQLGFPVSGAGSNIPIGTLMIPGAAAGTNKGVLIPCTSTSTARGLGILSELHNYSASGDALTQTLTQWFAPQANNGASYLFGSTVGSGNGPYPTHGIDLISPLVAFKMDYNQNTTLTVTSVTSHTQYNITSEVAGQDSAFLYFNAGTGIGQIEFVASSGSGQLTVIAAATTDPDTTTRFTKIMPLFWEQATLLVNTTTVPTQIDSKPGITSSGARVVSLANFININGLNMRMDPKILNNQQGLNNYSSLNFFSYCALQDAEVTPIS